MGRIVGTSGVEPGSPWSGAGTVKYELTPHPKTSGPINHPSVVLPRPTPALFSGAGGWRIAKEEGRPLGPLGAVVAIGVSGSSPGETGRGGRAAPDAPRGRVFFRRGFRVRVASEGDI